LENKRNQYLERLTKMKTQLCLGTVQFGLEYGINNKTGQLSENDVFHLLDTAYNKGVRVLDTAGAYGNAEELLGRYIKSRNRTDLKLISKLMPKIESEGKNKSSLVVNSVSDALSRLNMSCLDGFLLHNPEQIYDESIVEGLIQAKNKGYVNHIGLSSYKIKHVEYAVDRYSIDYIQMPFNIFDHRLVTTGLVDKCKEKGVKIFARSPFLQGLFFMEPAEAEKKIEGVFEHLLDFNRLINYYELDRAFAALRFLIDSNIADYAVFGVDNIRQLEEIVEIYESKTLEVSFISKCNERFKNLDEEIILPSLWK